MDQLQKLIELAQTEVIAEDEHEAQLRSFAYGNTRLENDSIYQGTKVDQVVSRLYHPKL